MFEKLGGNSVVEKLVDDFYSIMRTDPKASNCLKAHEGRDMKESAEKLKAFLSGWLGGPQLYLEKFGHPRLRMRHSPFAIGELEATEWLYCMDKALKESTIDPVLQIQLLDAFRPVALMLKNKL